jgi:hypothetical protein
MTKKYNPLPLLQYANHIIPDWYNNRKALSYINIRLLSIGWCVNCGNTETVEVTKDCGIPKSECCGGCTELVECENCK